MAEIEIETGLRENTVGMLEQFAAIAATDPLVALVLLAGTVLIAFSMGVFGVLTVGAILSTLSRLLSSPRARPR